MRRAKLVSFILKFSVDFTGTDQRALTHGLYSQLLKDGAWPVRRSYFASYGSVGRESTVNVHVSLGAPRNRTGLPYRRWARSLSHVQRWAQQAFEAAIPEKRRRGPAVLERRGDLSKLHTMMVKVALHPDSANAAELTDAIHWLFNMAGYDYHTEMLAMLGQAYSMGFNVALANGAKSDAIPRPAVFKMP